MITQSISNMVFTLGVVQYIGLSQYAAVKVRIVKPKKMYHNMYCLHMLYM